MATSWAEVSMARGSARGRPSFLASPAGQFVVLLLATFALRFPIIGEWNYDIDDEYYALIGQRILHGATLYVDIWDRKGPALYYTFAAAGLLSASPAAYQILAMLCVAATAYGVNRLARIVVGPVPAMLAGIACAALPNMFGGQSAQAPVFYDPLVLLGAWSIVTRIDLLRRGRIDGRIVLGIGATGLAIAFKQSVAIEAAVFGAYVALLLWAGRRSTARFAMQVAALALTGALPMLVTGLIYYRIGHFPELWHALVTSNLDREYYAIGDRLWYLLMLSGCLALPLAFAAFGIRHLFRHGRITPQVAFLLLWLLASMAAVALFPVVYLHYAMPLLAPLSVFGAVFYARRGIGPMALAALVATSCWLGGSFDFGDRAIARRQLPLFEDYVVRHTPGKRLLVWGVPGSLYARVGSRPPSAFLFAPHYYERSEAHALGRPPERELARILAWAPETVVVQDPLAQRDPNLRTIAMVQSYVRRCRTVRRFDLVDHFGEQTQWVYSGCAPASRT